MSQDFVKASLKILVVDCHEICLGGTLRLLQSQYSDANILTAQSTEDALDHISKFQPDLLVMDIYIPENPGTTARTNTGIQLLKYLMNSYPKLNIVVQSAHLKTLVRIKTEIDMHQGGFTIADKSLCGKDMLTRVKWALQGLTHIKDIQGICPELEIKPEWLRLLTLAFNEGLQDKAIAQHIRVSERMVRHYWDRLQNALGIDCQELKNQGKNIRVVTQIRAREVGLID